VAINIEDVRHFMLDFPELNKLHDSKAYYSDPVINRALNWSVEQFNSEPPLHIRIDSLEAIPSNSLILMGATIWLLRSTIINMQRNHLDYNDGGITVSDKSQHQYIMQFLSQYVPEYKDLLSRVKQFLNINQGFGGIDSQWRNLRDELNFRSNSSTTSST